MLTERMDKYDQTMQTAPTTEDKAAAMADVWAAMELDLDATLVFTNLLVKNNEELDVTIKRLLAESHLPDISVKLCVIVSSREDVSRV